MIKEKYGLNLLSPKYNILKEPGSPSRGSGWKHSKETKANMKIIPKSKETIPKSKETIAKFSMGQQTTSRSYLNQIEPVLGRYTFKKKIGKT